MTPELWTRCPDAVEMAEGLGWWCECHSFGGFMPVPFVEATNVIAAMALFEMVPWATENTKREKAGTVARRIGVRAVLELAHPGDGHDGAKIRATLGEDIR